MAVRALLCVITVSCVLLISFGAGKESGPTTRPEQPGADDIEKREAIIAGYVAELRKTPTDCAVLPGGTMAAMRVLGKYRAKEATSEIVRLIGARARAVRDDIPYADAVHIDAPPGWGPPQLEYPATRALIEIGLPSIRAITDAIERPGHEVDEKTCRLFALVIYEVLGDDHARAWLLEERRHCPKEAEGNYDKLLSMNAIKFSEGKDYRRQPESQPASPRTTTERNR